MKTIDRRVGRRKVHSNRFKRMRKGIEVALIESGVPFASVFDRLLVQHMVPSKRMQVSVQRELSHDFPSLEDWGRPVQVFENSALLWVVHPDSPRGIYQRVKRRVRAIRGQGKEARRRQKLVRAVREAVEASIRQVADGAFSSSEISGPPARDSLAADVRRVVEFVGTPLGPTRPT